MTPLFNGHKKRILLIEASDVLRQGLNFIFRSLENVASVDEACDIFEAMRFCIRQTPDLIVMGISSAQNLHAFTLLQNCFRDIRVILLIDEDFVPAPLTSTVTCISRRLPMAEILSTLSSATTASVS